MKDKIFDIIEIEINHKCNMSCSYCPNAEFERVEKGEMEPALFTKLLSQLKDMDFKGVMSFHFYNEPLLSPNLANFTAEAKKTLNDIRIHLYTNGTLLSLEKFQELNKAGIDKYLITKHEGVSKLAVDTLMEQISPNEKDRIVYKKYTEINLFNRGGLLPEVGPSQDLKLYPCHIPYNMIVVTVKGSVIPCFEDFYQKHQMGNISEKHLKEIWYDEKYIAFRETLRKGLRYQLDVCKNCNRNIVLF